MRCMRAGPLKLTASSSIRANLLLTAASTAPSAPTHWSKIAAAVSFNGFELRVPACISFFARFDGFHGFVGETEVMADLVDQHMPHDGAQRLVVLRPIIENWPPVEDDGCGFGATAIGSARGEVRAVEQAEYIEFTFEAKVLHRLIVGKILDREGDLAGQRTKLRRQLFKRGACQPFDVVERRRAGFRPVHALSSSGFGRLRRGDFGFA